MDALDRAIINSLQGGFPVCDRPYAEVAQRLGTNEAELMHLAPGHYMAIARATDNGGQTGDAPSVHFEVIGETRPGLSIELMLGGVAMITWDTPKAILEYSDIIPAKTWTVIPNVASPFHTATSGKARFLLRLTPGLGA